jgi:hypothetical protein
MMRPPDGVTGRDTTTVPGRACAREHPRDVDAIVDGILRQYPDPPDLPPRSYDVYDRRQARDAIRRRLRRTPR